MYPLALFLGRYHRSKPERPSVIDEEYEWVYGRRPRVNPQPKAEDSSGKSSRPSTEDGRDRNRSFEWRRLSSCEAARVK